MSAKETVFVGDRVHDDIGGAKKSGMMTILTRQYRREELDGRSLSRDLAVERLEDILPFVLRLVERADC